jgi:hypothetical protein
MLKSSLHTPATDFDGAVSYGESSFSGVRLAFGHKKKPSVLSDVPSGGPAYNNLVLVCVHYLEHIVRA